MSENVKGRDTVARFGGEEFAIILRRTTIENATKLADQIRAYVQSKKLVKRSTGDVLGTITVSIGVARVGGGDTPASLIQRADSCLYQAKNSGRNRVVNEEQADFPQINAA
jgi:diguanylate cyclase